MFSDQILANRVLCSKLGSDDLNDAVIFSEQDPGFCVDITATKDGKFITVNSNSRTSSEVVLPFLLNK